MQHLHKTAVITIYTAAILSTNYLLIAFPNVKLFDFLVFTASSVHGLSVGVAVAVTTWLVYGTLNPWGAAPPPLLITLIASEMVFVLLALVARRIHCSGHVDKCLVWGVLGALGGFLYDFVTNVYVGVFFYNNVLAALILGIPFTVAHVLSNLLFFSLLGPRVAGLAVKIGGVKL